MEPELTAAIVACLGSVGTMCGAVALYLRSKAETEKSRAAIESIELARAETKESRDKDARELRDKVERNAWEVERLKEDTKHNTEVMEDLKKTIGTLDNNVVRLGCTVENLAAVVKELK